MEEENNLGDFLILKAFHPRVGFDWCYMKYPKSASVLLTERSEDRVLSDLGERRNPEKETSVGRHRL